MQMRKWLLVLALASVVGLYLALDLGQYLNLQTLKAQQQAIEAYRTNNPGLSVALYFSAYVIMAALSLPGAALLTLAGGAVFGLLWGVVIVSFASSIGATLAFLISRFLLRDWVQQRFGQRLQAIDEGVKREGAFYLFTLRLVPVFPFFLVNLLSGLTGMKARTFYWVSQLGMLAGTVVYVNAGTQLAKIDSLSGILSPGLLGSFALLGVFPLLARKIVDIGRTNKVFAAWKKPRRFDRNLIVIGAGSAGLVTSYIAAAVKAKVTLVEKHRMGGDCLNTGCVPSKALIRSARLLSHMARSKEFGIASARAEFDFATVMERVQSVIRTVEPHDSVARYTELGVEVLEGTAKDRFAMGGGDHKPRWRDAAAEYAQHRDRDRRASVCAAHPGHRGGRLPDLRYAVEPASAAPPAGRPRRRADRFGNDPGLCPPRLAGHAGGNGSAPDDPGRPGSIQTGRAPLRGRRDLGPAQSPRQAVPG
jgi:uncharacterized membrane protein YdjX (TVP38/TMEM64 family)